MTAPDSNLIPYGYCHCGCGGRTNIATRNHAGHGYVKGEPIRYIRGHTRIGKTGQTRPLKWHLFIDTHEVDQETGCWIWLRGIDKNGYAFMPNTKATHATRTFRAARAYYEHFRTTIPTGHQVDHLCRNKICVNPLHLEAVTPAVNIQRQPATKLDPSKVRQIRKMRSEGYQLKQIAAEFGVGNPCICAVVNHKTWKNVR